MLILDESGALIRVTTSGTADIAVQCSFVDHTVSGDIFKAEAQNTNINTATTTTVVSTPGNPPNRRNVRGMSYRNKHATNPNTLTIEHTDGTTAVELFKVTLAAGEVAVMNEAGVWFVYDVNGAVKAGAPAAADTVSGIIEIADQTEMEAASDVLRAVTPGRQHFHPGMAKFVAMTTGTTTPALQTPPSYNVTSITDTGVGRLTVTIANDFSSANWCPQATVMGISTTLTAIALVQTAYIRTSTLAAGTVEANARDATATTNALADPAGWFVCGWGDL